MIGQIISRQVAIIRRIIRLTHDICPSPGPRPVTEARRAGARRKMVAAKGSGRGAGRFRNRRADDQNAAWQRNTSGYAAATEQGGSETMAPDLREWASALPRSSLVSVRKSPFADCMLAGCYLPPGRQNVPQGRALGPFPRVHSGCRIRSGRQRQLDRPAWARTVFIGSQPHRRQPLGRGRQLAIVRTHSRACSLFAMPGNSRRSSTAPARPGGRLSDATTG
jgi:hypothetical protein